MPKLPPLTRKNLQGVWCALIVPWDNRDELDEARFAAECRAYAGTGVDGIYTGGTTGEYYAQDDDTFERVTRIACDEGHAAGLPVQIGCTTLSTRTARRRIRTALKAGADGIQIAYPFWLECKFDEVAAFMRDIAAEAGKTPLILYHTSRCKRKCTPKEIGDLARALPTFIGMKDTGCDVPTLQAMLKEVPDLAIFGGDNDFYIKVPAGGRGGYCSVTGLNTAWVVEYWKLCNAGRLEEAKPHYELMTSLVDLYVKWVKDDGLWDSAIDRVQRIAGGVDVGLACQGPYRSATPDHVRQLQDWCRQNAPHLLPKNPVKVG